MTTDWWDIAPLGWENILVCLVCGTLVGLERQLRGKPVGIRTSSLIILGTYCFLAIGAAVSPQSADQARGQLITGIGFLGAGVMMTRMARYWGHLRRHRLDAGRPRRPHRHADAAPGAAAHRRHPLHSGRCRLSGDQLQEPAPRSPQPAGGWRHGNGHAQAAPIRTNSAAASSNFPMKKGSITEPAFVTSLA